MDVGRRRVAKILVALVLDGQVGEYVVVDERRAHIDELAGRLPSLLVLVQVARDHVVQDGLAEKL